MTLTVTLGDPRHPEALALLQASQDLMRALFNPEDNHFLSVDALCKDNVRFFVAQRDGKTLGCAALKVLDGYGEIKSMFVAEKARGSGAADALMRRLEAEAKAHQLPALRLETGDTLKAAHRLYQRHGFTICGVFGGYVESPASIFMEKQLS